MAALDKLQLPHNTAKAVFHTRLNDEKIDLSKKLVQVGNGHWKGGLEVVRLQGDKLNITGWTVEHGWHKPNFTCLVTADGKLVQGRVNCFALGYMPMDDAYLDEIFGECGDVKWDEVVTQ